MDSLLSNAQRCVRKADSLMNYGLYDESLTQLEKSISHLNELKSITTCYESIQLLNAQLESIDRKMRSVAIKRSESNKKKNQIENLLSNKNRRESSSTKLTGSGKSGYTKLDKDGKNIVEELATTNAEYKKVNTFLLDEIEQLRRENEFLKQELLKHMMTTSTNSSASLRSSSSIIIDSQNQSTSGAASISMNVSSTSSTGMVPQPYPHVPPVLAVVPEKTMAVTMPPTPIISVLESTDHDVDDDDDHMKHPPIDLSRYINEEDDDEESGYNECSGVYSDQASFLIDSGSQHQQQAKENKSLEVDVSSSPQSSSTRTTTTTSVH